ncbi:hypothetical protein Z969_02480 [Clostridium novyi A str. 4570]|uniref:Uncharacterized protein n=1 Tax=Clostridium novyi A str. 4570 TaxID=1444290 RepID=A0AA88ZRN7_CLONO|nr:hypothetical protein [Clostridium novyi]KGN03164.1 hypothetical protein Z969_02480 [Clostridium novyi A str. 4570]
MHVSILYIKGEVIIKKKFITKISIFLLAFVIFTTSATPAFAEMKCESKSKILYYDPIANKKQQDGEAALIALGLFGGFGAPVAIGKLITAFTSAAGWIKLTKANPNKKPVKYQLTVTRCIDYDILKKHPFHQV